MNDADANVRYVLYYTGQWVTRNYAVPERTHPINWFELERSTILNYENCNKLTARLVKGHQLKLQVTFLLVFRISA